MNLTKVKWCCSGAISSIRKSRYVEAVQVRYWEHLAAISWLEAGIFQNQGINQ
jgi:hypothetical protein